MNDLTSLNSEFYVEWKEISRQELSEFRESLDNAKNEYDVQAFLESNPRFLLQHLPARDGYWVVPRKRLGSEHETDFIVGESDAGRFTWQAVELERPQARMFTGKGDPSAALTHALRQLSDWRTWLSYNRDYSSRPRTASGLGLTDIEPELEGLVIIGREKELNESVESLRRRMSRDQRVRIHTFDWLYRQAEERLKVAAREASRSPLSFLFADDPSRRVRPESVLARVFNGVATSFLDLSATRSMEWTSVYVEVEGSEYEIACESVRRYRNEEELSLSDWEDWLARANDEIPDCTYSILVSERKPDQRLIGSLIELTSNAWLETREPTMYSGTRVDVLVWLSSAMGEEERDASVLAGKRAIIERIPRSENSIYDQNIDRSDTY